MRRIAFFVLGLAGCGAAGHAPADPLSYLRVGGVDPRVEAEASAQALAEAGYRLGLRLEGAGFVALDAVRVRDRRSAVRVYTAQGAALSVDAPDTRDLSRRSVRLLPASAPFELDGGEGEELALEVTLGGARCVAVVQIDATGRARELSQVPALPGVGCAHSLRDVVGDARPELLATARLGALGLHPVPEATVVLVASGGRYEALTGPLATQFYVRERQSRLERLEALEPAEGAARLALAAELSLVAKLAGEAPELSLQRFDEAAAALPPELASERARVREALAALDSP